jgi:phytoene/squalene synthetase
MSVVSHVLSSPTLLYPIREAVAGLVGEGLSRLFACTGYEKQEVADVSKTLANTMGLLLQKTNIIRDYLEDYVDGRAFWPQEVRTLWVFSAPLFLSMCSALYCESEREREIWI